MNPIHTACIQGSARESLLVQQHFHFLSSPCAPPSPLEGPATPLLRTWRGCREWECSTSLAHIPYTSGTGVLDTAPWFLMLLCFHQDAIIVLPSSCCPAASLTEFHCMIPVKITVQVWRKMIIWIKLYNDNDIWNKLYLRMKLYFTNNFLKAHQVLFSFLILL